MRLAVLAHQARAIHAERHGQVLHRDVMDDVVVRPLQEGAVDRHHGADALGGEPARERDRVAFGDADVEEALRPLLLKDVRARARRHRGRDRDEVPVLFGQRGEGVAEDLRPRRGTARLLAKLARDRIVGRESVPLLLVLLGELEALPLLREHVNHARALHGAHEGQRVDELLQVVPVDGPEVAEPELLEQHAGRPEVLDALLDVLREVHHAMTEDAAEGERHLLHELAQLVGTRVGDDGAERLADRADIGRDRHAVVVDDEDDVAVGVAGIVHPFV